MTLLAKRPGFGWEEMLGLLIRARAEGTLSAEGPTGPIDLLFQNGMVLMPLASSRGSRQADQRRANALLLEALRWREVSFRFKPGVVPPGTIARRSLVLRQERVLAEAGRRSAPGVQEEERPAVWGDLPGEWLPALLRGLGLHRRSGRIVLETEDGTKLRLRLEDGELRSPETWPTASVEDRELRRILLCACRSVSLRFAFVAIGRGAAAEASLPPGTGRLLGIVARQQEQWRRVHELLASGQVVYRLRSPGLAQAARELTGLPRLVAAIDGSRSFAELLAATDLPPLLAAHALARLLVEQHAVAMKRPGASKASSLALGSGDLRALAASPSSSSSELAPTSTAVAVVGAATGPPAVAPRTPVDFPPRRSLESEVLACAAMRDDASGSGDSRRVSIEEARRRQSTSIRVRHAATSRLRRMRAG